MMILLQGQGWSGLFKKMAPPCFIKMHSDPVFALPGVSREFLTRMIDGVGVLGVRVEAKNGGFAYGFG
jgi:hypothetical protein